MKTVFFYCLLLGLTITTLQSYAQKTSDFQDLKAIRLEKSVIDAYQKASTFEAFSVSKTGVLSPLKGYRLLYNEEKGVLCLLPITLHYKDIAGASGYDEVELPGGSKAYCSCGFKPGDDCIFRSSGNQNKFVCSGGCDCGVSVIFRLKTIIQWETQEGNWYDIPRD